MAKNADQRGLLSRWYRRLRWLRRLAVIVGIAGGVAKALQGRKGGGSAAPGSGWSSGGPGGSGRPAPTGGPSGPRLTAATATPPDDESPTVGSGAAGVRTLVSVPPLVDDDEAGDEAVTAVGDGSEIVTAAPVDDAAAGAGDAAPSAPVLKIVSNTGGGAWMPPLDDGACPDGYPIKANDNSGIYHVPGGRSYNRTAAERCYASAEAAEADGYRQAKA